MVKIKTCIYREISTNKSAILKIKGIFKVMRDNIEGYNDKHIMNTINMN